ncbi:MAG: class I SAM-dependent methyltransferase [Pedobacter sp.]|nr:MAG: class I SAM-dependent methyltransferase [Pedobacter sp.]
MDIRDEKQSRLQEIDIDTNHSLYLHYKYYHKALFAAINKYAKGNLLDIGCGNVPYKKLIEPLTLKYIGCDIVQSSNNCVDILCPANKIPIEDEKFDTILSTQTIEHVEDHQGVINEAYLFT